jgi:hypothetical protein
MLRRFLILVTLAVGVVSAQDFPPGSRAPSVAYFPPEIKSVYRGHPGIVQLQFRIASGFHINSNQPKQEYLKKTELRLDAPTDIAVVKVKYPAGEDRSFTFDPSEKLNVYSGDFAVDVTVRPLKTVLPANYAVHGTLKYQACDNAACYPPKQMPISFEIKVSKDPAVKRRNPPQSPHAHS